MRLTLPAGPARKTILRSNRLARRCALAGSCPADVPPRRTLRAGRGSWMNDRAAVVFITSQESSERLVVAAPPWRRHLQPRQGGL